ncbi:MAG: type VI secretion system baseplate subunit TssG [Gammaproteobacteria bacterium]|nr:type VI secretion system baseplate subunit TssG [Gammaproteobacteria bacterium]
MDTESVESPNRLSKRVAAPSKKTGRKFFQAVRQLQAEWVDGSANGPRRAIGRDFDPEQELLRFRAQRFLAFPAEELENGAELSSSSDGGITLGVNFMGLNGPAGVLPDHYSELIVEQYKQRNEALRDFLDIFNHRSISLFYRAWAKYRLVVNAEASGNDRRNPDPITRSVLSLMGIETTYLGQRYELDIGNLLHYAGHFINQQRGALGLSELLTDFLGLPVEVHQFQGEWLALETDDRVQLPDMFGRSQNNVLGQDFVIGDQVFCVENRFELALGPMHRNEAEKIRPGTLRQKLLCRLITLYVGHTFQFDIRYVLRGGTRPDWQMSPEKSGLNLGWNCWLPQQDQTPEVDEILIPYKVLMQ